MTRAEAKALGFTRYSTGVPCKHGHYSERNTGQGTCLACGRTRGRARYDADPEKYIARGKAARAADPDKFKARDKARYAANPERGRAQKRETYAADPEKFRKVNEAYYKTNAAKIKEQKRDYRSNPAKVTSPTTLMYAAKYPPAVTGGGIDESEFY